MHLPDGVLSQPVCLATSAVAAGLVALAARRVTQGRESASLAHCAIVGGAVFAAQAFNFPIGDGVSGHFVGSVLAAAVLGPWTGFLVVAAVLAIQAVVLGDGGLTTLGVNILNMAGIGNALVAILCGSSACGRRVLSSLNLGIVAAVMPLFAAGSIAAQFALSGRAGAAEFTSQLLLWHLPLTLVEALGTVALLLAWPRLSLQVIADRRWALASIAALGALAVVITFVSSSLPDPLESALAQANVALAQSETELSQLSSAALMAAGLLLTLAAAVVVAKLNRCAAERT